MNIETLNGEVITNIDVDKGSMRITTASGRTIDITHDQDCCESVYIHSAGNLHRFVGKVIDSAKENVHRNLPDGVNDEYMESYTVTDLVFQCDGDTEIVQWIGESNGYYSERVDIHDISYTRDDLIPEGWHNPNDNDWAIIADQWEDCGEDAKAHCIRHQLKHGGGFYDIL